MPAIVIEPDIALRVVALLARFEPLQHLLKYSFFLQPRHIASLAGLEALSEACVVPQFQQVGGGCVLPAVAAATSGGQSSFSTSCAVPAARLDSRHELPPPASWRAASHLHLTFSFSSDDAYVFRSLIIINQSITVWNDIIA